MRIFSRVPPRTRRLLLDCALILAVYAVILQLNASLLFSTPDPKLLAKTFGSSPQQWHHQVIVWWLVGVPTVAAILIRHRWPWTALLLAMAGVAGHPLAPGLPHALLDLITLVTLFTLASAAGARRVAILGLVAVQVALFGFCLIVAYGVLGPYAKAGKYALVAPDLWCCSGPTGSATAPKEQAPAPDKTLAVKQSQAGDPLATQYVFAPPVNPFRQAMGQAAIPALLLGIAWAAGDNARTRKAHLAMLETRAADLEREQEQRTALAIATERGRITRELHDVVAHGLSVMVVQAQGAQAALGRHPDRSQVALTNVVATGRASLAEMRRLLGLVRSESAALAPLPSLATLPDLIEGVRGSGLPVAFQVTGEAATLPAGVELSAYRIIQEALTNILKHADPGGPCAVELDFSLDRLRITVSDSGTCTCTPVFGNGLRGIRERVSALGGTVYAGPAEQGGFEVKAVLPLELPA
jgi:signal transduction histidine kinase